MNVTTSNLRIAEFEQLEPPAAIHHDYPITDPVAQVVATARESIRRAIAGNDKRLVVITGPCSLHDPAAAIDYAKRLAAVGEAISETIIVVMRVYFEKPRTTVGWKGLINDPKLDGSCDINFGLRKARELLLEINGMGLPCASEFLDPIVPQYTSDLVAWSAIGARTTESQTHREMTSGLSMPVGLKNATDGSLQIALDAMVAARRPHSFLGINAAGRTCVVRTTGNPDVHLVMRGGERPNYKKPYIAYAKAALEDFDAPRLIMVDCSHGNSNKEYIKQKAPFEYLIDLYVQGESAILGLMLESNLVAGRQSLGKDMVYGQSVTDACLGWEETEQLLRGAHAKLSGSAPQPAV